MHSSAMPWLVRKPNGGTPRRVPKCQRWKITISRDLYRATLYATFVSSIVPYVYSASPYLEIHEQRAGNRVRLHVTGELDLASMPALKNRLERLRAEKQSVLLDLSGLEFIDSAGIHLLISAFQHAREDGWQFALDEELAPQVQHLFELTDMERVSGAGLHRAIARQALPT